MPRSSANERTTPSDGDSRASGFAPDRGPATLLEQVLAAAGIAVWEAWESTLELVSFTGAAAHAWMLHPGQTAPGTRWDENIFPPDRPKLHAHLRLPAATRTHRPIDYRLIVGEGELLWVRHWTLSRTPFPDGRNRLSNAIMAIPEQKHLEWECLRVSERECNRIGQELHDDLCQVLAGLGFMMRVVELRARKVDPGLAGEIEELNTHLYGATDRVRSMAHGLFPARLQFTSLRDALSTFATEVRTLFRIRLELVLPRNLPRHSPEQIIHVYRIAQESLGNAVRHGRASAVQITVAHHGGEMQVRIADNGDGFLAAHARPEGIGMHVMQYRARILGGSVSVKPANPKGVAVELAYPAHHSTFGSSPYQQP